VFGAYSVAFLAAVQQRTGVSRSQYSTTDRPTKLYTHQKHPCRRRPRPKRKKGKEEPQSPWGKGLDRRGKRKTRVKRGIRT